MHHAEFWACSLREYDLITRASIDARDKEFKARRVINQELGILVRFAFHDPKNMPDLTGDKTGDKEGQKSRVVEGAQGAEFLRAYLNRLHHHSNKEQ